MSTEIEMLKQERNKVLIERDRLKRRGRPYRHLSAKLAQLEAKIYRKKERV